MMSKKPNTKGLLLIPSQDELHKEIERLQEEIEKLERENEWHKENIHSKHAELAGVLVIRPDLEPILKGVFEDLPKDYDE
jgi:hypothetical protein